MPEHSGMISTNSFNPVNMASWGRALRSKSGDPMSGITDPVYLFIYAMPKEIINNVSWICFIFCNWKIIWNGSQSTNNIDANDTDMWYNCNNTGPLTSQVSLRTSETGHWTTEWLAILTKWLMICNALDRFNCLKWPGHRNYRLLAKLWVKDQQFFEISEG